MQPEFFDTLTPAGIPAGVFCDLITEENARPSYHDNHIHTGRNGHDGKPEEKKSGRGTERVRSLRMLREGLSLSLIHI